MSALRTEEVLAVQHWSEGYFSLKTTRDPSFRFESGHFVMLGIEVDGRPLTRAYSIVSPNWADYLEFLSVIVPDGPLTSRLKDIKVGDKVLLSAKPVGTLVLHDLNPGKNLFLFSTGTGLAPFMSIVHDPEVYELFEKVVLVHSVRRVVDLAYHDYLTNDLPNHEFLGEEVRQKLVYYPTVTREPFRNTGRITTLLESNKLTSDVGLPPINPTTDRAMICGSMTMLKSISEILDDRGFQVSPSHGQPGDYVIERAFVER
jgi:ferredoxin--NADP+ reductase